MNLFWSLGMITVGALLFFCARTQSQFVFYKLLVARSRHLWGDKVYRFHQISGILVFLFGLSYAIRIL